MMRRWFRYLRSRVAGPKYITIRGLSDGDTIDWWRETIITDDTGKQVASTSGPNKPGHVGVFRVDTPPTLLHFLERIYK